MAGRLAGKVAFITGTGGGQGRAAALLFAREGARIVGCDVKVEGNTETAAKVKAAGGEMAALQPLDLGEGDQVKQWIEFGIKAYGRMDILYNNAAVAKFAPIEHLTEEEWRFTIHHELDLIYLTCHYAWPHLKANGHGIIINTASMSALVGHPVEVLPNFAHAAAKGGVISLTRQLAVEGAPYNIRANCISPGVIVSPATEEYLKNPGFKAGWLPMIPLNRLGNVEEIAYVALFLASDECPYMTGTNLVADGGLTAR